MIERYNPNVRYRQRSRQRFYNILIFMTALCCVAGLGHWLGGQYAEAELNAQKREILALEQDLNKTRDDLTLALTQKQEAEMRLQNMQEDVSQLVPKSGPLRDLLELVKQGLEKGTTPERMSFIIRSTRPPQNCSEPEIKRLIVTTPDYQGEESRVSVNNGKVIVTAKGQSAQNQAGAPEAWYDQGREVEVSFKKEDGSIEVLKGTLPLATSVVSAEREYRFSLSAGARSFIKITYDSCDYP